MLAGELIGDVKSGVEAIAGPCQTSGVVSHAFLTLVSVAERFLNCPMPCTLLNYHRGHCYVGFQLVCVVKYKLDRIWHRINNDAKQVGMCALCVLVCVYLYPALCIRAVLLFVGMRLTTNAFFCPLPPPLFPGQIRARRLGFCFCLCCLVLNFLPISSLFLRVTFCRQKLSSTVSECPECLTHFSDMDLCELFDEATGQFQCRYCKVELVQKVDHAAAELNSVMTKSEQ